MAESLPAHRALYKKTTDPDNAWAEAVGGEFQAESGVEYEVCCVGPSSVTKKTWTLDYHNAFVMTVRTTTPNETFTWPGRNGPTDALFDWGDGTSDTITEYNQAELTHTYATPGDHDIKVSGTCGAPLFNDEGDKLKVVNIKNWGILGGATVWDSAFYGCSNLIVEATDVFGANVTDMSFMFRGCLAFNQSVSNFDTSNVTDMSFMFRDCPMFNQSVSNFDTSNVTNMSFMFYNCPAFNQSVSNFDTSNVTNMLFMFRDCLAFNQSVSNFDTSNVVSMASMFRGCQAFNQSVSNFDTSSVTDMSFMFYGCLAFNQSVSNFDTSNVTDMSFMFRDCPMFNQSVSNFDTSSVTDMYRMFYNCSAFNQSNVDGFLQRLYQDRLLRTSVAPALELPTAPAGTYQDASPPTTGKEYEWQLENGADVTYKWTITY